MAMDGYVVEEEKSRPATETAPSAGPVYRSVHAKDGFRNPPPDLNSCWDIFRKSVEKFPDNRMLGHREIVNGKAGKYKWKSYKEVYDLVIKIGNSIRKSGVQPMQTCGIYGANCPEWVISMEACNAHQLRCVPLYDTLGAKAVQYIILHAEIPIIFVEQKKIPELLKILTDRSEHLRTIVSFGKFPDNIEEGKKLGVAGYSWEGFLEFGSDEQYELPEKQKEDICTIMYTSGTTGDPKGVLISNESIISVVTAINYLLECIKEKVSKNDVYLSYLPLAHIFDRVVEELFIFEGGPIGFWQGDVKFLVDDIAELKPTIFCAVPRVLDRIYSGLMQKINAGRFTRSLFNVAYSLKLKFMKNGYGHDEAFPISDKYVFNKVKQLMGGNVRLIISGAAPLSTQIETFFRVVSCAHVLQGYGLTESCAASFVSLPNNMSMVGTVGPPLPNVDVRLESIPEMNYDALAKTPRGEICIRGKSVFSGYHRSKEETSEVLVGGWLHTGDVGEWQPDGSMKIIDRKKNIFKLSQGEYVAPEILENIYATSLEIGSIWIYGNSLKQHLVAVVHPARREATKNDILKALESVAKNHELKGFQYVKNVHLDSKPFEDIEGLLTPTFKKKRRQFQEHYQKQIDEMYDPKT